MPEGISCTSPRYQSAGILLVLHTGEQLHASQIVVNPLLMTFGTPRKKKIQIQPREKDSAEPNVPLPVWSGGETFTLARVAAVEFQARLPRSSSAPEKQVDSQGLTQPSLPLFLPSSLPSFLPSFPSSLPSQVIFHFDSCYTENPSHRKSIKKKEAG